MAHSIWFWVAFNGFVLLMLALDLGVFHRRAHEVRLREAAAWSAVWVAVSLLFNAGIWLFAGRQPALEFLTGYLVEKSLAVDNVFVIALIFSYFAVPARYQHRVLFWGILGALAMRGAFIAAGSYALERWHWTIYVFGAVLLVTGIKLALRKEEALDPARNPVLRLARKLLPVSPDFDGQRFFTIQNGRRLATPLLLALVMVEVTDLVFAVDSIPAVFAVTKDPFVVYTSNVLAILGLRSMYFLLAGVVHRFVYLKVGLALVLVFVGAKMLLTGVVKLPVLVSLAVIALLIGGSVALSLLRPPRADGGDADDNDPPNAAGSGDAPAVDAVARNRRGRRRAAKARRRRAALAARRRALEAEASRPAPVKRLKLRLRGY